MDPNGSEVRLQSKKKEAFVEDDFKTYDGFDPNEKDIEATEATEHFKLEI